MKEEKARQAQSPKGRGRPSNPKPIKPSASNYVPIAPKSIATISDVVGGVSEDYSGNFRLVIFELWGYHLMMKLECTK